MKLTPFFSFCEFFFDVDYDDVAQVCLFATPIHGTPPVATHVNKARNLKLESH